MKRFGKAKLSLHVYGDWQTVIGAREYREQLIDQKPDDAEDFEYSCYRIPVRTTEEAVTAYMRFHAQLKLRCYFAMLFESEDGVVRCAMQTGEGYARDPEPLCDVSIKAPLGEIETAAKQAIEILKAAIK